MNATEPLPIPWERMVRYQVVGVGDVVDPPAYVGKYFSVCMERGQDTIMFLMSFS